MNREELLEILVEWNFWDREPDTGTGRGGYINELNSLMDTGQVVSLVGVRRSGKSTLLLQFARFLIETKKVEPKDTLIVNFEDYRFSEFSLKLLKDIYELYLEKLSPKQKPYIFLDEVHNIPGWERFVRTLHEKKDANLLVSGSSSKLMSPELATVLTGRHLPLTVFPLSFREYLSFKGIQVNDELDIAGKRIQIRQGLGEYMESGGFPKVVLSKNKRVLGAYFDDILTKDVVKRFRIRETGKLKTLAKFYLTNIASPITFNSIKNFLNLPLHTVERFSYYLESSHLIHFLPRFSFKVKEQENSPRKVYCIDHGLANALGFRFSENFGKVMENIVYTQLKRLAANREDIELYYWKDKQQREVDFVVKERLEVRELIQVCWDPTDPETRNREIRALVKAMSEFKLEEGMVVTGDYEAEERVKGKKIKFVPLWKWLLVQAPQTV